MFFSNHAQKHVEAGNDIDGAFFKLCVEPANFATGSILFDLHYILAHRRFRRVFFLCRSSSTYSTSAGLSCMSLELH